MIVSVPTALGVPERYTAEPQQSADSDPMMLNAAVQPGNVMMMMMMMSIPTKTSWACSACLPPLLCARVWAAVAQAVDSAAGQR